MRDSALLGRAFRAVASGDLPLSEALAHYARRMLDYGFAAVGEAAAIGQQRMPQNPLPAGRTRAPLATTPITSGAPSAAAVGNQGPRPCS